MQIQLTINVDLTHLSGKFVSKADLQDAVGELIHDALNGELVYVDDSEYEVTGADAQ